MAAAAVVVVVTVVVAHSCAVAAPAAAVVASAAVAPSAVAIAVAAGTAPGAFRGHRLLHYAPRGAPRDLPERACERARASRVRSRARSRLSLSLPLAAPRGFHDTPGVLLVYSAATSLGAADLTRLRATRGSVFVARLTHAESAAATGSVRRYATRTGNGEAPRFPRRTPRTRVSHLVSTPTSVALARRSHFTSRNARRT